MNSDELWERVSRMGDYDLAAAFSNNGGIEQLEGLAMVIATIYGENDGAPWHWLLAFFDGRYAYATGGCDYTGWDCQSSASIHFASTQDEALALADQDARRVFEEMLSKGENSRPNTGGL